MVAEDDLRNQRVKDIYRRILSVASPGEIAHVVAFHIHNGGLSNIRRDGFERPALRLLKSPESAQGSGAP